MIQTITPEGARSWTTAMLNDPQAFGMMTAWTGRRLQFDQFRDTDAEAVADLLHAIADALYQKRPQQVALPEDPICAVCGHGFQPTEPRVQVPAGKRAGLFHDDCWERNEPEEEPT